MGKEKRIIDFNIEINKKKKSSTISKEALQNPYNKQMTFSSDFVSEHYLEGMISDQHFYQRFSFFFNFKFFLSISSLKRSYGKDACFYCETNAR